ncbi:glycosyltransferase family 4 protein [Rhizohabitans arisaemae]|uniref:glycosyltransferase family 4 protein n=1 Tax=Rhizohabitans arisaemae TaxID=2720610 RepID=UPI0024B14370|nr:glycosyltransferase family 4 protein [Rhizohabitans arisaemae]
MRVLVGLHHLELGGSQLNALDLATKIRDRGHHVEVFATHTDTPGPVADLVRARGLPLTLARHPRERPARGALYRPSVAAAMTELARTARIDLVHAYEYPLILDAFYGPHLRLGAELAGTVYAMAVPTWLPGHATLVAGTRDLVHGARAVGQRAVLIEPPVDTDSDDPVAVDGLAFRRAYGIADDELAVVVVSRLEPDMKEEGIAGAMGAIKELGDPRLRFVVVGTGPSVDSLARRAAEVNTALGREAITMTGALADPRPAYAAADIALGMGGSALRAMAFGKPLVVLGVKGFSRPFDESSCAHFFEAGFFGVGDGHPDPIAAQLAELAGDSDRRTRLGALSRRVVLERYSLDVATDTLERLYGEALAKRHGTAFRVRAAVRTALHRTAADLAGNVLRTRLRPLVRRVLSR